MAIPQGTPTSLADIASLTGGHVAPEHADVTVTSAAIGSSDVQPGGLFFAVPGTRVHGATYAASSSAAAVVTDAAGQSILDEQAPDLPRVIVEDVRSCMGDVAAEIYDHPSRELTIIGITGTSGKTTTSYLIERALMTEFHVGLIGTTGTRINGNPVPTKLTTPEAPTMQALLARMRDEGVTHVVMEVSSHALELGRVKGIGFDVAAFTNLSQDHLDFHPTMDAYFRAKTLLFTRVQDGTTPRAVICVDDSWGEQMAGVAAQAGCDVTLISTAAEGEAARSAADFYSGGDSWSLRSVSVALTGRQDVSVDVGGEVLDYSISLAGNFNVANSVLAIACATAAGLAPATAAQALKTVQVPGRMQAVDAGQDFLAMVDYAHKPGAVAAVVNTLADYLPQSHGRIGVVLGAGGNRDHDKRPKMGYEAARIAHAVFVTDDNPRDEDPAMIRAAVEEGARDAVAASGREVTVRNIADRREAIREAVAWAQPGDAVVIAGKGHETGQEIAGVVYEFNDVAELTAALEQRQDIKGHNAK
ncbi:UDP-N-acetylmuramoyl-L-alanyl-D-glutamate--2,6-diaminopimelate ligase [Corynebacterium sp. 320]|uniref:UDP-N-acetylmuramoyl-L-alanyl-D-glutamate--2,6-diaminopimelate ligase n=1 Tax=Corynebacterium zhongnanshanii TaxID=2768834 RepID=A0ABQ6VD31_9CORY|nr:MULTISPECIES: UDP-N-acetylmuramoyl-L-alanyl-D-glutamate--2,6-diaminopimelate ligase [Corynebacterium]KAB1502497.1 UDP-N-acetylmuramoyl-L-alanyl-D-glutamate--2,6-diaminopimelate ligase [Corynebacterium sp. 320]KAB1551282.1 UDP-N-acetylmuramoyl-L-alanyl-D-glutamate--2,6-diaminopimelate ligase [Corynebacterium sp. 321]KAB1551890.1 UDP-N-acetylmuramoyl-L-alanyl-D-glutamate--2,6-diaminopimelate ligase [Corynebacterium sp. 319]KAB3520822.1 UDP-N-acetylmuramoyl-L-alanyl-D-glutamate--2,6-diaminopime